jgi:hypothetical protein
VSPSLDVVLEVSATRSFACALWFPGWFGHGKTPDAAIDRLLEYRKRYAPIAKVARRALPPDSALVIVEELEGNGTTQFGAPGRIADAERDVDAATLKKLRALHAACHDTFDEVVASAPATLRKGPRGGGRDTAKVVEHVLDVEKVYARSAARGTWPEAYYLRRSGYHFTDHAWEIQDRSTP